MFKLQIEAETQDFFDYLQKESTKVDHHTYLFSSIRIASLIIARFLLFFLKRSYLDEMIFHQRVHEKDRSNFTSYVCVKENQRIFLLIIEEVQKFLQMDHVFHVEGFIRFRLKQIQTLIEELMETAFETYLDAALGMDNISWFRSLLEESDSTEEEINVVISDDEMIVKGEHHLYLKEEKENEDNMLAHCILLAPKKLFIYDVKHQLSKEMVLIIKRVFLDRVVFYEKNG